MFDDPDAYLAALTEIEAQWREKLVPFGQERVVEIDAQIAALQGERRRLVSVMYPEGSHIAGEPHIRLLMREFGLTRAEAVARSRSLG